MCVRNAYCCLDCKKVFAMPLGQSLTRYLLAPVFTHLTKKDYSPIEKFDYLCLNLSCQRRNEAGYKACMNMSDPCWFCLRFGHEQLCHTRVVHTLCPNCYSLASETPPRFWLTSPPGSSWLRYPHYRTLRGVARSFLYADLLDENCSDNHRDLTAAELVAATLDLNK